MDYASTVVTSAAANQNTVGSPSLYSQADAPGIELDAWSAPPVTNLLVAGSGGIPSTGSPIPDPQTWCWLTIEDDSDYYEDNISQSPSNSDISDGDGDEGLSASDWINVDFERDLAEFGVFYVIGFIFNISNIFSKMMSSQMMTWHFSVASHFRSPPI